MQDPERLLDGGTEFERSLLQGGAEERPTGALTRKMAIGAGVGGALSYTSTAKAMLQTWWGKAAAALTVGAGVAGVIAVTSTPNESTLTDAAAPPVIVVPTESKSDPPATEQPVGRAEPAEAVLAPPETDETPEPPRKAKRATPTRAPASTLAQEVKLLDRARALVAAGDHAAALRVLNTYEQRYPRGTLEREARVLRSRARAAE